jgi:TPR repeat protein
MRWGLRRGREDRSERPPASVPVPEVQPDGTLSPDFLERVRSAAEAGDSEAMANLGAHLAQQGLLADAIDWTERAWRGGNLTAGFNLGTFYSQAGDTHRADLVWTEAAQLGDPDAMMCVARLALQRGDRATADRWLALVLGQSQPYPITALGVAYRDNGDTATALRVFDRAIALGDAYAMEYAARIQERNGNTDTADRLREQAMQSPQYGWGLVQSPPQQPPPG